MSLAQALERAAAELPKDADAIRPANGDPVRLLERLDAGAATRVLLWLLREDVPAGEELALAWAELDAGVEPLRRAAEAELDKPGRKALRRALHRLRSRGVELKASPSTPLVARLPRVEVEAAEGLVSQIDPSGGQLLILAESNPAGGMRVFEAVLDDERGIVEFRVYATSRSKARQLLRELGANPRLFTAPAPPEALRARLARVAGRHPGGRALPTAFIDWRARLAPRSAEAATPGDLALQELEPLDPTRAVEQVLQAIEAGQIGPWPPSSELLRTLAERMHELARSPIVLSEVQRRERVDEILRSALAERGGAEGTEQLADRLAEMAYVLSRRGREGEARACAEVARELRSEERAGEHPVARALLERALAPLIQALEEEERSSPIAKP